MNSVNSLSSSLIVDSLRIVVSAGEISGDQRLATVVESLQRIHPTASFCGMGGDQLRSVGVETVVDSNQSGSVMGITDVIGSLGRILGAFRAMKRLLRTWKPDLLIVCDYPDFNLRLARYANRLRIPVLYFIPPKVWAWRKRRVKTIANVIDQTAVIFPFEQDFYESEGYGRAFYVGHPFTDELHKKDNLREKVLTALQLHPRFPTLAVFPGSRKAEVERHLSVTLGALARLKERHPTLQAVLVAPTEQRKGEIKLPVPMRSWCKISVGNSLEVLQSTDAGLLKSGTCNLEAAFFGLPFVCFYKLSRISAFFARRFLKIQEFSLVNIIRSGTIPELLQERAREDTIEAEVEALLFDGAYRTKIKESLNEVVQTLQEIPVKQGTEFQGTTSGDRTAELALALASRSKRVHETDKQKDSRLDALYPQKEMYRRTIRYLTPYKWTFIFALLGMVIYGVSDGVVPFLIKEVLDRVFNGQNPEYLYLFPFVLIGITFVRALADFWQQFLMSKIGHLIVRDIRNEMNDHFLKLNPDYFLEHSSAHLVSRITSDVLLVRILLTESLASVIRDSIRMIALAGGAIYLDPTLALLAFVAFPVGVYPIHRFAKRMKSLARRGQEGIGQMSATLQESILGNRVVKVCGAEAFESQRFREQNQRLTRTFVTSERIRALTGPINEVLASLAVAGVIFYGGHSVMSGTRTQGEFIAFLLAVFLLYDPFKKMSRVSGAVSQGFAGATRIFEVLDTEPSIKDPTHPVALPNENTITFKDVAFEYKGADRAAVREINLTIPEGQKIALVGLSGAGKSTLVDLIPRFMDPSHGEILLGGVDISKVRLSDLRARIALVGQHTFLFNDTIYNNILYGNMFAGRDQVVEAAKNAYAFDFIDRLPNGFDTIIGEGGFALSGGERQRISIARAILKNASILILDEATASLDNQSEREVQSAIEKLEQNRTRVVIAHRLSTVQNADLIVVMKDGAIVETGRHEKLLEREGEYSKLYALQFR